MSKEPDIKVTDARDSQYAPGDSIEQFETKHPSVETINDRAWEQSFGKGGSPGAGQ